MSTPDVHDAFVDLADAIRKIADTIRPNALITETVEAFRTAGECFVTAGDTLERHFAHLLVETTTPPAVQVDERDPDE